MALGKEAEGQDFQVDLLGRPVSRQVPALPGS